MYTHPFRLVSRVYLEISQISQLCLVYLENFQVITSSVAPMIPMLDDDFIAGRIRWRASKHGLPNYDTHEFADAPDVVQAAVNEVCAGYDAGLLVLVFGNTSDRWTVIGTRAVVSYYGEAVHHCPLSQIVDFDRSKPFVRKQDMEYFDVTLTDTSTVRIWGPRGSQFSALWNILLSLSRMNLAGDSR